MLTPDLSSALTAAPSLLGWELVHHTSQGDIGGIIIETEAYLQEDEASHSYRGLTKRTAPMFLPAGHLYMYFIYGMHWCLNIVTGPEHQGEAVLLRALRPSRGLHLMQAHRGVTEYNRLTNGPGSLVQALAIPSKYSGLHLKQTRLALYPPQDLSGDISTGPRVGITKAAQKPWRFRLYIAD